MINNYFIFHYHNEQQDYLTVYFNDGKSSFVLYDINKIMKIKINGLIRYPSKILIDVINTLLDSDNKLDYCKTSGFVVCKIIDLNQNELKVFDGKQEYSLPYIDGNFCLNNKVVVAKKGTMLTEGNVLTNDVCCSYKDLGIEDNDSIYIIDEDIKEGTDFFFVEGD